MSEKIDLKSMTIQELEAEAERRTPNYMKTNANTPYIPELAEVYFELSKRFSAIKPETDETRNKAYEYHLAAQSWNQKPEPTYVKNRKLTTIEKETIQEPNPEQREIL